MKCNLFRAMAALLAAFCSVGASAQAIEGLDYVELNPPPVSADPDRIVVQEFFSYQCPHCYSFEPYLREWVDALPDDVVFVRVPTSLGRDAWVAAARSWYALRAIGASDDVDLALFRVIHLDRERLFDEASIADWVEGQGIDREAFMAAYNSFGVNTSMNTAERSFAAHRILSIPALTIDGRYRVLIKDDGTYEQQLAGVDELIDRIRAQTSD